MDDREQWLAKLDDDLSAWRLKAVRSLATSEALDRVNASTTLVGAAHTLMFHAARVRGSSQPAHDALMDSIGRLLEEAERLLPEPPAPAAEPPAATRRKRPKG